MFEGQLHNARLDLKKVLSMYSPPAGQGSGYFFSPWPMTPITKTKQDKKVLVV